MKLVIDEQEIREAVAGMLQAKGYKISPEELKLEPQYRGEYDGRELVGVLMSASLGSASDVRTSK